MMVIRYDCQEDEQKADGHYVTYEDYEKLEDELKEWKEAWVKVCQEGNVPQYENISIDTASPNGILHGVRQLAGMVDFDRLEKNITKLFKIVAYLNDKDSNPATRTEEHKLKKVDDTQLFNATCVSCGSKYNIQLWPHRNKYNQMVGTIYVCDRCADQVPNMRLTFEFGANKDNNNNGIMPRSCRKA